MHLHLSRVCRNGKTYEYGQLVESYRRADGMPTQRVVAKLGRITGLEADNLRAALEASRGQHRVVLDRRQLPPNATFLKPTQNLRYLDVAVMLELWRRWGLDRLLEDLLPRGQAEVAPGDIVAALTLQRCVDPGSKLYAERWFPRTALPELLGIAPDRFNNTRLHRVLEQLDEATAALMRRLPLVYQKQDGAFVTMFLDVTDARFVGHGPELSEKAKTKEGIVDRKVGIVLLCNEHGYPLRWQTIAGKRPEPIAMHEQLNEIRGLGWVGTTPVVCDRAMGTSAEIALLLATGLRFVTALKSTEFPAYTNAIPHGCVADLEPAAEPPFTAPDPDVAEATHRVEQVGMQHVSETIYVLDLGVVQRDAPNAREAGEAGEAGKPIDAARTALMTARQIDTMVQQGEADSCNSAARKLGLTVGIGKNYRTLLQLDPGVQQDILAGKAATLSTTRLRQLARIRDAEQQRRSFERSLVQGRSKPKAAPADAGPPCAKPERVALRVRAVVLFNPECFVEQRRNAQQQLEMVQHYVRKLNDRLSRPKSRRTLRAIEHELDHLLRRHSLLDIFRAEVHPQQNDDGTTRFHARVELDPKRWQRRRRFDGFMLLVAHPDVPHTAAELSKLYRAKDAVEKDFQVIKSLVKLRPIWHRTDAKVRAHITLCMLALLLERTLKQRLRQTTSSQALESLASCCLNRFEDGSGKSHYLVTHPDTEQRALLRELQLEHLADDDDLTSRLRPR